MKASTLIKTAMVGIVCMTIAALAGGTVITGPSSLTNNSVTDAKLRDSNSLSVIGRSANSSGDPGDIVASSDGDVLRRSGTSLGFGPIPESSVSSLTSDLAGKVPTTRTITAGTGLTGGGDLSSNRTLTVAIAGATCGASEAVTAIGSTGTGTCSTVGDITSVVASTGLTGGATSGAATLTLDFPTTACSAGQAITSHSSTGAPTCSTFVNAAGTGLSLTGSSLAVNISGASCSAGQFVSAISATGGGTCSTPSGGGDPGVYAVPGEGTCTFDCSTTPICGATLSGGVYDMQRDIAATTLTVNGSCRVKTDNYKVSVHGTLTVNGTLDVSGSNASGGTAGQKQNVNNTCGAGTNGGSAGCCTGANASSVIPWGIFPQSSTNLGGAGGGSPTAGSTGTTGRGGGGGGCNAGLGGSAGTNSGTMNSGGTYMADTDALKRCRLPDGSAFTGGTGGGPGGQETTGTATAGAGGGGGGVLVVIADTLAGTGTIASNGGNGGNGSGTGVFCAGGGGGGGGGILGVYFRTYSGSLTVSANGGTHGTGAASAGKTTRDGGDGGAGVVVCVNTSGDGTKPTGCP